MYKATRIRKFLSAFRDAFKNGPQYRHFQAYVVGWVIYLGSRNLAGLSRAIPDGKSACSLYRFVAQMDWDIKYVERVRWKLLNRRTRWVLQAAGRRGKSVPIFIERQDALAAASDPDIRFMIDDIQHQHQTLSRRAGIAHFFDLVRVDSNSIRFTSG